MGDRNSDWVMFYDANAVFIVLYRYGSVGRGA